MRDINASTEVATIVGEEDLARLRTGAAFARYTCWACGRPGLADTQPASVVVELGEQAARVSLPHARCARSHVVELRDVAVPAVAEDSDTDMAAKAAVFPYPGGSHAVLILEPRVEIAMRSPGGERIDVLLTGLLSMGLSLVHAVGELPGPAPGWQLELPGRRQVRVTAADGSVMYAGSCGQPRRWRQQIAVTGRCVVLTGPIGLYACPGRGDPAQLVGMVEAAARAGQLAGATIRAGRHALAPLRSVSWRRSCGVPQASAEAAAPRAARMLLVAMSQRHCAGADRLLEGQGRVNPEGGSTRTSGRARRPGGRDGVGPAAGSCPSRALNDHSLYGSIP